MEKEPWQEDIYENQEEESRTERRQRNKKGSGVVAEPSTLISLQMNPSGCCFE